MNENKQLWDKQKSERDRVRRELQIKIKTLLQELNINEIKLQTETKNQIESERDLEKIDFGIRFNAEVNSFNARQKDIEDKYRFQDNKSAALQERESLKQEFNKKLNDLLNEQSIKMKEIDERNQMKQRHEMASIKAKYELDLNSVFNELNGQIIDLEEKLKARENNALINAQKTGIETKEEVAKEASPKTPEPSTATTTPWKNIQRLDEPKRVKSVPKTKDKKSVVKKEEKKKDTKDKDKDKPWADPKKFG